MKLSEQYKRAKAQVNDNTFENILDLHVSLLERLSDPEFVKKYQIDQSLLNLVNEKIEHSKIRLNLPAGKFKRMKYILGETLRRRFFDYSYGVKSIAQDIFLR